MRKSRTSKPWPTRRSNHDIRGPRGCDSCVLDKSTSLVRSLRSLPIRAVPRASKDPIVRLKPFAQALPPALCPPKLHSIRGALGLLTLSRVPSLEASVRRPSVPVAAFAMGRYPEPFTKPGMPTTSDNPVLCQRATEWHDNNVGDFDSLPSCGAGQTVTPVLSRP
jgi:hypothetical protein